MKSPQTEEKLLKEVEESLKLRERGDLMEDGIFLLHCFKCCHHRDISSTQDTDAQNSLMWAEFFDETTQCNYYQDTSTGRTTWTKPEEFTLA